MREATNVAVEVNIGGDGELFVGEDKSFRLTPITNRLTGLPENVTGWVIHLVVRRRDGTPDPAIFDKTAAIGGVYNVNPTLNTQYAEVQLTDTELNTVKALTYRHSWKRMDDGSETVLAYGNFVPQLATAR